MLVVVSPYIGYIYIYSYISIEYIHIYTRIKKSQITITKKIKVNWTCWIHCHKKMWIFFLFSLYMSEKFPVHRKCEWKAQRGPTFPLPQHRHRLLHYQPIGVVHLVIFLYCGFVPYEQHLLSCPALQPPIATILLPVSTSLAFWITQYLPLSDLSCLA